VALLYRHWPLPNHRFAFPAARASECAAKQGRFEAFHDVLFAQQDSLPAKSFAQFAREAGDPNLAAFERCASSQQPVVAIERDLAEARRIGGTGTATIVINGMLIRAPYSDGSLAAQVQKALDRTTVPGKS
jgi:protein-disulfide isomerase